MLWCARLVLALGLGLGPLAFGPAGCLKVIGLRACVAYRLAAVTSGAGTLAWLAWYAS